VDLDAGLAEAVDKFRVAHALEPRGGVDARDPEAPELALAVAAVPGGGHARTLGLLFCGAGGRMLAGVRAPALLQPLPALLFGVDGALDAAHRLPPSSCRTRF